jgi:hypothetical protein
MNKIKFIVNTAKWFDKTYGNTYHTVRITRVKDGQVITSGQYQYGSDSRQTALKIIADNKWIPAKYRGRNPNGSYHFYLYERENNYPISWNETIGLKRDMIENGRL